MSRALVVLVLLAACGGGSDGPATPDAGVPDTSPPDSSPVFAACAEFTAAAATLPLHFDGLLSGADVQSPSSCGSVDAPYGIASAGPDSVIALANLTPGTAYIVDVESAADLAFYVATGCSTDTGPSASECAMFVDANVDGDEFGRFVATGTSAYVVVDYYQSATPSDAHFTLDVYAEACTDDSVCDGGTPVCDRGHCVECADSFDCHDAALPRCDRSTSACAAGVGSCVDDDAGESDDDGPAGATALSITNGQFSVDASVCSWPSIEADFYAFTVAAGETWDVSLTWSGSRDLDLEAFDANGYELALSFWEQPESARLSYLPAGTYYLRVTDFSGATTSIVDYTLAGQRASTTGCTDRSDCAADYRNQLFRGDCVSGACVPMSATDVAAGGACDSEENCAASLTCPAFLFVADADTRNVCSSYCTTDPDCAAMGEDYVCTTYFTTGNFCVQKCTTDDQCPTDPSSQPVSGPWYRLQCETSTGRCVFQ